MAARTPRVVAISALTGEGVPALLAGGRGEVAEPLVDETLSLGFDQGRKRAWLFDRKLVRSETQTDARLRGRGALDRPRPEPVRAHLTS